MDRFQEATTAYSVLNAEESRNAYWDMYKLRCYLHQGPAAEDLGQVLAPFYIFHVRKQEKTVRALSLWHAPYALSTLADGRPRRPNAGVVPGAYALARLDRGLHSELEER